MKKKILLTVFFFSLFSPLFAQHYRVGAGFIVGLPSDNLKLGGGFDLFVEYKTDSPFSFRTEGGFAITGFKDPNPYVTDIKCSLYWLEGSLIYTPFQSEYEPYIGLGIGNYFIAHEDFNEVRNNTGNYSPQELNSKFSYHAKLGFIYPISESIKINAQAKYLYLPHEIIVQYDYSFRDSMMERTIGEDFDLSTVYLNIGVIIKI